MTQSDDEEEWATAEMGEASMPGNKWLEPGGAQRVVGSVTPPRHWRTKAKAARVSGRMVRRRRSFEVKDWEDDVVCDGRRGAWRWWWFGMLSDRERERAGLTLSQSFTFEVKL